MDYRRNRWFGKAGRLLLFIRLNEQLANANDNKAKPENFGCTHLGSPPFYKIRGQEAPLTMQGANRLPFIGSAAYRITQKSAKHNNIMERVWEWTMKKRICQSRFRN